MKTHVAGLLLSFLLLPKWLTAQANIPIGTWRTHFSYQDARLLALTPEQAYVASANGLFTYHFSDNTLNVISKLNGLSDAGISAISYQPASGLLVLAYRSGIVDILSEGRLASFVLLAKEETGELINAISHSEDTIYLATSEGVRVLEVSFNPLQLSIRESYTRLGDNGEPIYIYDVAISGDSIFLATEEGILGNSLANNVNRQDFRSWRRFGPADGLPSLPVRHLAVWEQSVYAAVDGSGIYEYEEDRWQISQLQTDAVFKSLNATKQGVVTTTIQQVWVLDETVQTYDLPAPQDAHLDQTGSLWVADSTLGLVKAQNDQQESLYPNGPLSDAMYSIHFTEGQLVSLLEASPAFSVFEEGRWINYDSTQLLVASEVQTLTTLTDVAFLPADEHFYFGSAGSGLFRWDGADSFTSMTNGQGLSLDSAQISAVEVDNNLLWVTSNSVTSSLYRYDPAESLWQSFSPNFSASQYPLDLVFVNDRPWMITGRSDVTAKVGENIFAYDPDTEDTQNIRAVVAAGNLPGGIFTDMQKGLDGQVWLSGNEGISYLPAPSEIFTASSPSVVKPIFENQFLLFGEYISAIAVDGGNRKWVGTRDGVWLFEEKAEALVLHFTANNSPLPSDNILDIAINDQNGEVFILTDQGLLSYRGTASEGQPRHQNVKIFPNPVPLGFGGMVGIECLVRDATLKITTISGRLVRQVQADGGTAVWNLLDYNGSRVATGVYLVFSASDDGSETFVGKIAVVN